MIKYGINILIGALIQLVLFFELEHFRYTIFSSVYSPVSLKNLIIVAVLIQVIIALITIGVGLYRLKKKK